MKKEYFNVHIISEEIYDLYNLFAECCNDGDFDEFFDSKVKDMKKDNVGGIFQMLSEYTCEKADFWMVKNDAIISGTSTYLNPQTLKDDVMRWIERCGEQDTVITAVNTQDYIELHVINKGKVVTSYVDGINLENYGLFMSEFDNAIMEKLFSMESIELNAKQGYPIPEQVDFLSECLGLPLRLIISDAKKYPKDRRVHGKFTIM